MTRKILIISASPRKNGNSDTLCNQFALGAQADGKDVEKVFLGDYNINYCQGCGYCSGKHECIQKDDASSIIKKMIDADVIVLASPVYFYCINGQLKTLIDRTAPYYRQITNKVFYFLLTAADNSPDAFDESMTALNGFIRCLDGAEIARVIKGIGVYRPHEIKENRAFEMAYVAGEEC